jgi:Ca2+-binding EF-hand superfamily protein
MKTQLILICSAALLAPAAMAEDADSSDDKHDMFTTLDADSDGKLSKEEAAGHSGVASNFISIDRNSDGFISEGEFRRNVRPKPK